MNNKRGDDAAAESRLQRQHQLHTPLPLSYFWTVNSLQMQPVQEIHFIIFSYFQITSVRLRASPYPASIVQSFVATKNRRVGPKHSVVQTLSFPRGFCA